MKKPPCIRGLDRFKNGCPEEEWNPETGNGCPAWIVRHPLCRKTLEPERIAQCLDLWMLMVNWDANKLLEGNQQAIESFRNGSLETDETGRPLPKTSRGLMELVGILQGEQYRRQVIAEHEAKKFIEGKT